MCSEEPIKKRERITPARQEGVDRSLSGTEGGILYDMHVYIGNKSGKRDQRKGESSGWHKILISRLGFCTAVCNHAQRFCPSFGFLRETNGVFLSAG